jgi:hypothetical protein
LLSSVTYVATEDVLLARLRALGCEIIITGTTTTAYLVKLPLTNDKGLAIHRYFPKAYGGIGFTQAQLDDIEQELAYFGIDLLPLGP